MNKGSAHIQISRAFFIYNFLEAHIVQDLSRFVWGPVMLALLVGTGIFLMVRLRFMPLRRLGFAIRMVFSRRGGGGAGDISPFEALMTALAATIGTGNIAGVATAIALGGPGAVFWIWVTALFGMATKYGEAVLAVRYRVRGDDGKMRGGPMYALERGLPHPRLGRMLARLFAVFAVIASLGIGNMAQANAVSDVAAGLGFSPLATGIMLSVLCGLVMLGGIKSIAHVTARLVPLMGGLYILGGLVVIALHLDGLGEGIAGIVSAAFCGQAAAGAFAGASVSSAVRYGVARGVFSNEAGLGSASIAAAAARTDHPARQGLVSMTGTFFDTLVVCTVTALVIACTGLWQTADAAGNALTGAALTAAAFEQGLSGVGHIVVAVGLALFALTSILGWSYYGERSIEYLLPRRGIVSVYRLIFCGAICVGAVLPLEIVWHFSDTANALMAVPNLVCLLWLNRVIVAETNDFFVKRREKPKAYRL